MKKLTVEDICQDANVSLTWKQFGLVVAAVMVANCGPDVFWFIVDNF